jgi:hypothetical protein
LQVIGYGFVNVLLRHLAQHHGLYFQETPLLRIR